MARRIRPAAQIHLMPPALVPTSESDWRDAVSALAVMLVPVLDSMEHGAAPATASPTYRVRSTTQACCHSR